MEDNRNPRLVKNGGPGTNVGNALRWLANAGKKVAPELDSTILKPSYN